MQKDEWFFFFASKTYTSFIKNPLHFVPTYANFALIFERNIMIIYFFIALVMYHGASYSSKFQLSYTTTNLTFTDALYSVVGVMVNCN